MCTPSSLLNLSATVVLGTFLGYALHFIFRSCFFHEDIFVPLALSVLYTGLIFMPRHFADDAGPLTAAFAFEYRLVLSTSMYLARLAVRRQTPSKTWHPTQLGSRQEFVVSRWKHLRYQLPSLKPSIKHSQGAAYRSKTSHSASALILL